MLFVPEIYNINPHSPFYYSNTSLFNAYHRILSVQMNHQLLFTNQIVSWCLPPINYQYAHLNQLFSLPEKVFYQLNHLESFLEYYDEITYVNTIKETVNTLNKMPKINIKVVESLALYRKFLNNIDFDFKIPILMISEPILSNNEYWGFYKEKLIHWLQSLVRFFKELTEAKCLVEQVTFNSFTYNEEGNIQYFHEFHKLKFARNLNEEAIRSHNLRELAKSFDSGEIMSLYQQYLKQKKLQFDKTFFLDNIVFSNISKLQSEYSKKFMDFHDYEKLLEHNLVRSKHSIGVYVDLAYMYIGLESYFIDFDILLTELLGYEKKGQIADLISVQFKPKYSNKAYEQHVHNWLAHIREQLLYYNFNVQEVSNETSKAKQIIDGEEYDVDDQYLMTMLRKNRTKYSEVILFTGDLHFIDEIKELQQQGVIVHLISCNPRDSNQKLIDQADYHYYIKEFIDSLYIKKEI